MSDEKHLTEQESLKLITTMIHKAKNDYHESGNSSILWGTVVGIVGLLSFAQRYWHFDIGFDIWWIVLAAFIPQMLISIREGRNKKVLSYESNYLGAIWTAYGLSIFMLLFYFNITPGVADRWMADQGEVLLYKNLTTGETKPYTHYVLSGYSLLLLLYGIPTLATGMGARFRAMIIAGILCYVYFIISCFTTMTYDFLLNGIAGITNWLIPGLILKRRYKKSAAY